jgi:hypothetical protein
MYLGTTREEPYVVRRMSSPPAAGAFCFVPLNVVHGRPPLSNKEQMLKQYSVSIYMTCKQRDAIDYDSQICGEEAHIICTRIANICIDL